MQDQLDTATTRITSSARDRFDADALFLPQAVDGSVLESVVGGRLIADESAIEAHRFFELARGEPDLLRLWVSQECVVTGPFSQLLLLVACDLENVHLRAAFLDVVVGEHGPVSDGVARTAHPYLLYRLSRSVGLHLGRVVPLDCTLDFLSDVERFIQSPLAALGVLGVGNERLLLTEYEAVRSCFDAALADADYSDFLNSNIEEDLGHSAIAEHVAAALISRGGNLDEYYDAARAGVEARLRYYDRLVEFWNEERLPTHWLAKIPSPSSVRDMEKL